MSHGRQWSPVNLHLLVWNHRVYGYRKYIAQLRMLLEGLTALSRREGVTLFMTLLAAWQTLLSRYSGQDDIVIGSPIANRQQAELEQLIGFFVNSLIMRVQLQPDRSFGELLASVRGVALEAYLHQDVPFEKLVEELSPERRLNAAPVFQVVFALQNAPTTSQKLHRLRIEQHQLVDLPKACALHTPLESRLLGKPPGQVLCPERIFIGNWESSGSLSTS